MEYSEWYYCITSRHRGKDPARLFGPDGYTDARRPGTDEPLKMYISSICMTTESGCRIFCRIRE